MGLITKSGINYSYDFSHKGFLQKYIKLLKEMKFLREDLIFSTHSEEVNECSLVCFHLILDCDEGGYA